MSALLDFGRDLFDVKVREAGNEFLRDAATLAAQEVPAVLQNIEREYGIPGSYLFFVMSKRAKEAQRILGRSYDMAQAVRNLWISKYTDYDAVGRVRVPPSELEVNFNDALQAFGQWSLTTFRRKLVKVFTDVLKRKAREYLRESGDSVPEKNVRLGLYQGLPLRVTDHPFWFSDSITLSRLLEVL